MTGKPISVLCFTDDKMDECLITQLKFADVVKIVESNSSTKGNISDNGYKSFRGEFTHNINFNIT